MVDKNPWSALERLPTGLASLDTILGGGFFRRSVYLLTGAAGTGKTILANQICFSQVASGGRATYITLLAETHAHLFANLQTLSFFDRSVIGKTLNYFSGTGAFAKEKLDGLLSFTSTIIREQRPSLLVFDTLSLAQTLEDSVFDFPRFVNRLSVDAEFNNTTILLLSHPGRDDQTNYRNTLVDGVIQLHYDAVGQRTARTLEVKKFRGSAYLEGHHSIRISEAGVRIYPQTEVQFTSLPPQRIKARTHMPFGIAQLDKMMTGGPMSESATMLFGVPGTGKTLLGLQFLAAGAAEGQPGVYFGFQEPLSTLTEKAARVGININAHVERDQVELLWHSPLENILDAAAERLLEAVRKRKAQRVFIDSLSGFQRATDYSERFVSFFIALTGELRALGATTLFSVEMQNLFGPSVDLPYEESGIIADNILVLRYVELNSQLYRLISILKMRDSDYEGAIREFKITEQGIVVASTFESAQAILTGVAQPVPGKTRSSRNKTGKS